MKTIDSFQGSYRFLSNFWPVPSGILYENVRYPAVENAYVAAKIGATVRGLRDADDRFRRACAELVTMKPGDAKRVGRKFPVVPTWEMGHGGLKLIVMGQFVREKFSPPNSVLVQQLLDTGDSELIEGNTWGDKFWGRRDPVRMATGWGMSGGIGLNHLGKILMVRRAELRKTRTLP